MSIYDTIYAFGSTDEMQLYGRMVFSENGKIIGYHHPNENSYKINDDTLLFF